MEEEVILGRDDVSEEFKLFISQYDAPAYIRRARGVVAALEQLLARCRHKRDEFFKMVRIRLGILHALSDQWRNLQPLLADDGQLDILRGLYADLKPHLRAHIEPTTSVRVLRRALRELQESLEHSNERWQAYLAAVDLSAINELRDGYNRYYVLEKECAVRSARVARQGFTRLSPLTAADLFAHFPLLPVPRGRD